MPSKIIACDMDAIIVALTQKWLYLYNRDYNDNVTIEDIKSWDMAHSVKIKHKIYDYLYSPGFFLDVPALPGALEALEGFQNKGHHVVIVSAPSWPGNSATDKISWCKKMMPWLNKRDIILGHNKHLIRSDVFIDDSPDNIKLYRQSWGTSAKIMTIAYPYNKSVQHLVDVYAEDYKDTQKAWSIISNAVNLLT